MQFTGFSFQLKSLYLGKYICFYCTIFCIFFCLHQQRDTTMQLRVGEYVASKDLNVFCAKTRRGALHK